MIHLLVAQDGKTRTITTGCNASRIRRPQDPMPEDVTAWASAVTCLDCLDRKVAP